MGGIGGFWTLGGWVVMVVVVDWESGPPLSGGLTGSGRDEGNTDGFHQRAGHVYWQRNQDYIMCPTLYMQSASFNLREIGYTLF